MAKKKYIVGEKFRGFYKLTHENSKFEYINDRRLNLLQKDKTVSLVEFAKPKPKEVKEIDSDNGDKELKKMNKPELSSLAKNYGYEGDTDVPDITKAILIEFIESQIEDQD